MNYKILFFLFLLFFFPFVFSDSLSQIKIKSIVPLNENLTISGHYNNIDGNSGILCSFRIFDVQTTDKYLITRLSDEYTFSDGFFSSETKITEPLFKRGYDYNVVVCCNTACFDQNFYVGQKEEIAFGKTPNSFVLDLAYWNDGKKTFIVFLVFIFVGLFFYIFRFKY